jgi:hypothetical protein
MNDLVQLRKITMQFEEVYHEGGPPPGHALVRGAIMAVARNPYAGRFVEDVMPYMDALQPLGVELARRLIDALGGEAAAIEGFGKGAIVGTAGEIEHGALWHQPGGYAMRDALGGAKAIVPSTKKVGVTGARLDVPLTHINASYVRSHFDSMEVGIADAPRPDEIVFVLAMSTGSRIHARCGGLRADEIKGEDGLR